MKIEAFIISWEGKQDAAFRIAEIICNEVETTVIDSNKKEMPFTKSAKFNWQHVPNHHFYGLKFKTSLDLLKADTHMLQIQADAECTDWLNLIRQLKNDLLCHSEIGVWSPLIDYTPYSLESVKIDSISDHLISVIQTDGIVWAIHKDICKSLKSLNYLPNNLGWGIDWAAVSMSRAKGKIVTCNKSIFVSHPRGSGYNPEEAEKQMNAFLEDLVIPDKNMYYLLSQLYYLKRLNQKNSQRWYRKLSFTSFFRKIASKN